MASVVPSRIDTTAGVCGGKPCISGTRVRVQDIIVWHEQIGLSPDEIVFHYEGITLADICAALSYYHDHRDEIRKDMSEEESLEKALRGQIPSKLMKKLADINGE
ncbi:MAG: DUF433 domain-containing protein [Phycisphaerae bacterium]